ncbi:MAG TPA: hypothetical protein VNU48_07870 [Burkholderiaceae bacterium]|nr:hypothetical protein [Burkholderiaceae bacterium]
MTRDSAALLGPRQLSLLSLWFMTRLPDLRLHDAPAAASGAAAAEL